MPTTCQTLLRALSVSFHLAFITTVQGECCFCSHLQVRKLKLRKVSDLLVCIWSLTSSLIVTCESPPGRDANQLISGKAAPVADSLAAGHQSYQGHVRELPSEWLTGQQEDHFSESLFGKMQLHFWLASPSWFELDTMQLFAEHAALPSAKLTWPPRAKQITSEPPVAPLRELCGWSEVGLSWLPVK